MDLDLTAITGSNFTEDSVRETLLTAQKQGTVNRIKVTISQLASCQTFAPYSEQVVASIVVTNGVGVPTTTVYPRFADIPLITQ